MKKEEGEEILMRHKQNGSFFVRNAERTQLKSDDDDQATHVYTLTFYMILNVYHARIYVMEENYLLKYYINNKDFMCLTDLVNYYKRNSVFRTQKLTESLQSLLKTNSILKPLKQSYSSGANNDTDVSFK